ncbi:MAG: hypothetical protein ACLUHA_07660 [Bacteroides stercoris]
MPAAGERYDYDRETLKEFADVKKKWRTARSTIQIPRCAEGSHEPGTYRQ